MDNWEVFACGSEVFIGPDSDVKAHIVGIQIRFTNLIYEVAWWDGTTRKTEYLTSQEITTKNVQKMTRIGLKPCSKSATQSN